MSATRTAAEFEAAARAKGGPFEWPMHRCSMCNYLCAYLFFHDQRGDVLYDAGCYCTKRNAVEPRTWQDVAEHYNTQTHPRVIAEYDAFWGFTASAVPLRERQP